MTTPAARPTHRPPRSRPANAVMPVAAADASAETSTRLWTTPSPERSWTSRPADHVQPVAGRLGLAVGDVVVADGRRVLGRVPVGGPAGRGQQSEDQGGDPGEDGHGRRARGARATKTCRVDWPFRVLRRGGPSRRRRGHAVGRRRRQHRSAWRPGRGVEDHDSGYRAEPTAAPGDARRVGGRRVGAESAGTRAVTWRPVFGAGAFAGLHRRCQRVQRALRSSSGRHGPTLSVTGFCRRARRTARPAAPGTQTTGHRTTIDQQRGW